MSLKKVIEDNTSSTSDNGVTVDEWYYKHLDQKGKRPNYELITALSAIFMTLHHADEKGLVKGGVELVAGKKVSLVLSEDATSGIIDDLNNQDLQKILLLIPCVIFCEENSKDKLAIVAGYLISFLHQQCLFIVHVKYTTTTTSREDFRDMCLKHCSETLITIDVKEICNVFNETPQRINRAAKILHKLKLIECSPTDKNTISINYDLLESVIETGY